MMNFFREILVRLPLSMSEYISGECEFEKVLNEAGYVSNQRIKVVPR